MDKENETPWKCTNCDLPCEVTSIPPFARRIGKNTWKWADAAGKDVAWSQCCRAPARPAAKEKE